MGSRGAELGHSGAVARPSTGASSCRLRLRAGYMLEERPELAREVLAFRENMFAEQGSLYGWRKFFVQRRFNIDSLTSPEGKAALLQVRSAARLQGWQEREKGRQGKQQLKWEELVPRQRRQRHCARWAESGYGARV